MTKLPPPPGLPAPPAAGPSIPMPPMMRPAPAPVMVRPPMPPAPLDGPNPKFTPPPSALAGLDRTVTETITAKPAGRLMTPGVDFDPVTGEVYPTPRYPEKPPIVQTADDIPGNLTPQQKKAKAAINNWYAARGRKIMAERNEREAREEMLRIAFPEIKWDTGAYIENEGTKRFVVGDGTKLKASLQDTYSIENSEDADAAVAKLPKEIQEMLVDWKPSLKKTIYKELNAEYKKIIAPFVTIKAGAPQVELED